MENFNRVIEMDKKIEMLDMKYVTSEINNYLMGLAVNKTADQ